MALTADGGWGRPGRSCARGLARTPLGETREIGLLPKFKNLGFQTKGVNSEICQPTEKNRYRHQFQYREGI